MGFSRVILNQCLAEHIGQTKRALRDRFGEHRRAIQSKIDDVVPQHFYQPGHQLKDIELINAKRESIRRAGERSSIEKAQTVQPQGNKQRGRPLNHLCTHWFHYYFIPYFILVYFIIIIIIIIMIIFVYIFFIISNIFIFYYLFLFLIFKFLPLILFYYFVYLFIYLFFKFSSYETISFVLIVSNYWPIQFFILSCIKFPIATRK